MKDKNCFKYLILIINTNQIEILMTFKYNNIMTFNNNNINLILIIIFISDNSYNAFAAENFGHQISVQLGIGLSDNWSQVGGF